MTDQSSKPKRHYHVVNGIYSYLPNGNAVFATKRDAQVYARDLASQYREDGFTVRGNMKQGWYCAELSPTSLDEYIEVRDDCTESDCLDGEGY